MFDRLEKLSKTIKEPFSIKIKTDGFLQEFKNVAEIHEIGSIYENSLKKIEKKNKGQFYTPREIVDYIISYLKIGTDKKIIDPSCGCGSFLLAIIDFWRKSGLNAKLENLYGIDIDKDALNLTKISLLLKSTHIKEDYELINQHLKLGNSVVENKLLDELAFKWQQEFSDVFKEGGFDLVVGNPPYVTVKKGKDFDPVESNYLEILNGSANLATLMIGKALEILKEGGFLAFVLPKTLLHVDSYSKLRKYFLRNTKILHIFDLGLKFKDVRGEQIILILEKSMPVKEYAIEIKSFKNGQKELDRQPSYFIPHHYFLKTNYKFLLFDNKQCYPIIDKIYSLGTPLDDLVKRNIFRGLPFNNRVTSDGNKNSQDKILRGKSISKFRIREIFFIEKKYVENISNSRLMRMKRKKILLQNIFSSESGIIAALDREKLLTLDTVTNIIVDDEKFSKYLLGLLHSKAINFFLIFAIYNKSKLTMHTDRSYIGKIPIIKNPDKESFRKINEIVDKEISENSTLRKENLKELDEIVFKLYGIKESEKKLINQELQKIISRKSWVDDG